MNKLVFFHIDKVNPSNNKATDRLHYNGLTRIR